MYFLLRMKDYTLNPCVYKYHNKYTRHLHNRYPLRNDLLDTNYACNANSFLISAIAVPGANPLGQVLEQFKILPISPSSGEHTYDIYKRPLSFVIVLYVQQSPDLASQLTIGKLASTQPVQAIVSPASG
jgi:hypothetical protein